MSTISKKWYIGRDLIFKGITLLLMIVAILPSYRSGYALPTLAVMEMIYAFIFFPRFYKTFRRVLFPILGYAVMCYLVALPFDFKMGFVHPFMSLWIWIFPIIMASELIKYKSFDTNRFIYFGSLGILMIIIVATLKAIAENPIVMRDITAGLDENFVAKMNSMNIGGFAIAYGCGVILLSLTGCLFTYKIRGFNKYLVIGLIVLLGVLVIMAQFTTLLIICGIIFCYQCLQFKGSAGLKFILISGIIIIVFFSKEILAYIIVFFQGSVTAHHLQEIYDSVFEDASYDNTRSIYMSNSIDLFLSSPILGNNVSSGINATTVYESHSTIMTVLCKTGIIGLTAYLSAFWKAFKPVLKSWDHQTKKILGGSLSGYYLLLAFLNPAENDIFSYCLGLVAILTVYYLSNLKNKEYV